MTITVSYARALHIDITDKTVIRYRKVCHCKGDFTIRVYDRRMV